MDTLDIKWRDTMMVGLLKRGLRGEERHQFTAEQLRLRDPEAHDRLMERARREIAAEQPITSRVRWHYSRRMARENFPNFRSWAFHLWNDFDLWALRDPTVELNSIRVLGLEFDKY